MFCELYEILFCFVFFNYMNSTGCGLGGIGFFRSDVIYLYIVTSIRVMISSNLPKKFGMPFITQVKAV